MTDELSVTYDFFGAHVLSEKTCDIRTSRIPQARVHQVGDSDGMAVLGPVPAQNGRNVVIRLDPDPTPASRPLARPLPTSLLALSDVFLLATGSLARTEISSVLCPKWACRTTVRRKKQLDSVIDFLVDTPSLEFFHGVPLVGRTLILPVVRDASEPIGCCGFNYFDLRNGCNCRTRRLDSTVMTRGNDMVRGNDMLRGSDMVCGSDMMRGTVNHECANTVFKDWRSCWN